MRRTLATLLMMSISVQCFARLTLIPIEKHYIECVETAPPAIGISDLSRRST
jgi:hypothetical protein